MHLPQHWQKSLPGLGLQLQVRVCLVRICQHCGGNGRVGRCVAVGRVAGCPLRRPIALHLAVHDPTVVHHLAFVNLIELQPEVVSVLRLGFEADVLVPLLQVRPPQGVACHPRLLGISVEEVRRLLQHLLSNLVLPEGHPRVRGTEEGGELGGLVEGPVRGVDRVGGAFWGHGRQGDGQGPQAALDGCRGVLRVRQGQRCNVDADGTRGV
mmetsp:Transcript_8208/g.14662  ORF Transcript_8208/g.14662 Transcript_8208/m.14662 type:complete len:210 (-) Transcript_8208:882-1511(-)